MGKSALEKRPLGRGGLMVSAIGLGCMGMSEFYGSGDDERSVKTIRRALDLGVDFLDTADMYGKGANEELVGRAIKGRREQLILATKFGIVRTEDVRQHHISGKSEYVRAACEASLRRLGVDEIHIACLESREATGQTRSCPGCAGSCLPAAPWCSPHHPHPVVVLRKEVHQRTNSSTFSRTPSH